MNSFDEGPAGGNVPENGPVLVVPSSRHKLGKLELWRNRLFLLEFIFVCLFVGIILIVGPWTSFWTSNSLLANHPQVQAFLSYDFVRGLISGLGLVDLWMAVTELSRYRENQD